MAKNNDNIGILDNLPDTEETSAPRGTSPQVGIDRDTRALLANLPDQSADPNAVLGLTGAPGEQGMDSTLRNFLSFGVNPNVYNTVKGDFDSQAKLHPQALDVLNITNLKLDARAEQHETDPNIPIISQGQPLTGFQKARLWFEDQFGITAKRQLDFEAQREGLSPEELADRVGANNVRLDRYLKFDPAAGAAGVLEGVAGGLEWLTDGEIGGDFANQMQILRAEMSPIDPNFLDQVSQGAGSMAMFFIPGLGVGSGVTRIFATAPRVANILGASTMTGLEAMTEAGLVWRDVFRKTSDQEQADKAANATFWLNVPLLFVTNKLGIFAEGGNSLNRFLRSAALEGTQEAGQEIISASATGEEVKFKDLATAFGVGAIIGGGAGSITGALQDVQVEGIEPPTAAPTPLEVAPTEEVAPVKLADIAEQVEAGTLTEDEAIEETIERRLTAPVEAAAVEEAVPEAIEEDFDELFARELEDATPEQLAEFRRIASLPTRAQIDAVVAAEAEFRNKILDTPEKRAAFEEIQRQSEITRGLAERKPAKTLRQTIEDELASPLAREDALAAGRRLLDEEGAINLSNPIALDLIRDRLSNFVANPREGLDDVTAIGRAVFEEGKVRLQDFTARMKEILGEQWEAFKNMAQSAFDIINNERGAITIGPEGTPEFDLQDRIQAIRTQTRSKELPSFMEDNPTWSEEEVNTALDRAQQGQPITEREAEIIHAAIAEAGANFYQEAIEDEFITLEPEEVDEIVQAGIQDFVSNIEVVKAVKLTAEQKKKKARTQEFRKRGTEITKLQEQLRETSSLLHLSVEDAAEVRQKSKQGTKEAQADVKRLESKIATRDKRIAELREKAKNTARTLPKLSTKAQIRQATGLSKAEIALVREDVALKEGIRQAMRASREAFRAGRQEGIAEAETRLQTLIDEAKARAKKEATGKKIIALTISENLPPGVRGQFVKALAAASTPRQFTKLATRVGDAIIKFEEAQKLKKNLATQRQKLGFIRKVGEFNQTVINEIKQEVGLTKPLTQATETQLDAITDRLKARLRFKRSRGFNPPIEGKESKQPDIQEVVYKANRDLSLNQKSEFRRKLTDVKEAAGETVDKVLGVISSRLADINPKLRTALRKFEFKTMTQIQKDQRAVLPFLDKAAKMSKDDHFDFDLAVKNGDIDKINELIDKYDMRAEYDKVRSTLDDIYKRANEVGFDIGYQQNYFPRQIKDTEGFLEWFGNREDWSIIQEAIQRKEMSLGRVLTFDEKVSLINTMIRGYSGGNITLSGTGAMKQRVIDFVSPELNQFYEDSLSALPNYIGQVDEAIGQRVFFGKSRPIDGEAEEFNNLDDSLGFYITDLITQGLISPSQEKELRQILQARFGEKGTSGAVGIYKNLAYVTLLGSPFNAVTQLGDMAFSLYAGGVRNVLTSLPKAIIGDSIISKEDIGIEKIAAEVENKNRIAELVTTVFNIVGLTKIDTVGKETLINSVILKYQKLARNEAQDVESFTAFEAQMQDIFEDETAELMEDLRNDVISENVKYLAFNELLNFQPIALSEVPQVYLTAGNGRIFYALKTWTLKMLDVYRNEVFRVMRTDKVQGVKNMLTLSAWLVTMNATADIIKMIMKGEDLDDEDVQFDILVDNLLTLIGFSRYSAVQARRDGIGSAVTDQISPPTNIVDNIWLDVSDQFKDSDESFDVNNLRSIKNIPIIGQLYYWWFGRAAERRQAKNKRR